MKRQFLLLFVALLMATLSSWATVRNVPSSYATIQAAIDASDPGDLIQVEAGTLSVTSQVNVNKANLTIQGVSNTLTKIQVSGTGYRFLITASGVTMQNMEIEKTDKTGEQNIIAIQASNTTIRGNKIHGKFVFGDGEISRAMVVSAGYSGLLIDGNTFYELRQPGYFSGPTTGTISNNYTYGTKGWVMEGGDMTFSGNTWGVNVFDIAILGTAPTIAYTDIVAMSNANNDAVIEDQRVDPRVLSVVYLDESTSFTTDLGGRYHPCNTMAQANLRKVDGGKIITIAPPSPTVTIAAPVTSACGAFDVPVKVSDFRNIGTISLVLNNNSTGLTYQPTGVTLNPAISGADYNVTTPGKFVLGWNDLAGITLADDAVLFTLHYNLLPNAIGGSTINFTWSTEQATDCEFAGPGGSPIYSSTFANQSVTVPARPVVNLTKGTAYCKIQTAVDAATSGDEIEVSPGTYAEAVVINKTLKLHGKVGETANTIILAPPTLPAASDPLSNIVTILGSGVSVELSHLTIKGPGPSGCGSIGHGIFVRDGAYANIHDNQILDIRDTELPLSGCQNGVAIRVGRTGLSTTGTATIANNIITGYQKGAIVVDNVGSSASITGNTVTGIGTTAITAQNGIQISRGATATLTNNTVSGNSYNASTEWDWGACGILLYQSGAVSFTGGNKLFGNDQNYYAEDATGALTLGAEIFGASTGPVTKGYYITDYSNQNIDASLCTFEGISPASATLTQFFAIEDRIWHSVDDQTKTGFVKVKSGNVYVTRTETGAHIQYGIDAAVASDIVHVQAGDYGIETAANRSVYGNGPHQFGLYIDKNNLTVRGYKSGDAPVTSASEAAVVFQTGSTANFGPDGVFVQGNGVTLEGLKIGDNIVNGAVSSNKTIDVIGDAFTMTKCFVNTSSDEGTLYFSNWSAPALSIEKYSITNNIFNNALISINSGAGMTGDRNGRLITGNTFTGVATPYLIGFRGWSGANPTQGWIVQPVGGAIVTGNTFNNTGVDKYIVARGNVGGYNNSQLNWSEMWTSNTYGNHVVTLEDEATFAVRPYNDGSYPVTRRISPKIQENVTIGQNSDVVLVSDGTYPENVDVTTSVTLKGANAGLNCASGRGAESIIAGSALTAVTVSADNVSINGFTIKNPSGSFGIYAKGRNNSDFQYNVITDIGNNVSGSGASYGVAIEMGSAAITDKVKIANNCINNIRGGENTSIAVAKSNNGSAGGIGIGWSDAAFDITNLIVEMNLISQISACGSKDFNNGGKGAYGVLIGVGAKATGKVDNGIIRNNEISNLEGYWSAGIGLEGKTPGVLVGNNIITNLTDHKTGVGAIGVTIQDNDGATTTTITYNSITNVEMAIGNAMPGTATANCNWYGSAASGAIAAKVGGAVTYSPWLTSGVDGAGIGFQQTGSCDGTPVVVTLVSKTDETCLGSANGAIDVTISGGKTPYSIVWTNSAATEDLASLPVGIYNVVVTDANGSTATLASPIVIATVADITPPVIVGTLAPVTVNGCAANDAPAAKTTVADLVALGLAITDNCALNPAVTYSDAVGTGTCPIVITRTYTVKDATGNPSTVLQTINIAHQTAPAEFGTQVEIASTIECASAAVAPTLPVVKDMCGNVLSPVAAPVVGSDPTCEGSKTYTYTYKDCANLEFVWTYTYTIDHTIAPVVPAAGAKTVACLSSAIAATLVSTVADQQQLLENTGLETPYWNNFTSIGQSFTSGTSGKLTQLDLKVGSLSGNQSFTLQIYQGNGINGTLLYSGNHSLTATGWQSLTIAQNDAPYLNAGQQYTFWLTSFTYNQLGLFFMYPNVYNGGVSMDGCTSGCSPTYAWQQWPDYDLVFKTYMSVVPVVTDVCGNVIPTPTPSVIDNITNCAGTRTYTYNYTDCSGLSTPWVYTYNIAPVDFSLPTNGASTVACVSQVVMPTPPTVNDACGNPMTPVAGTAPTAPACEGTMVYSWTYTDCAGFAHEWKHTITIDDNIAPTISFTPADITVHMNSGCTATGVNLGTLLASDNCGGSLTITNDAPTAFPAGETIVTWTVKDCALNSVTSTQKVTVVSNTLSGTLAYNNAAKTPMNNVTLTLSTGATCTTDDNGFYSFPNLCDGIYTITVTDNKKDVGSINSTDAGAANAWGANGGSIEYAQFLAGDVNNDIYINGSDAQRIQKYFVNGLAFDRTAWSYWKKGVTILNTDMTKPANFNVTVSGADVTNFDLLGMCTGDFNGSLVPTLLKSAHTSLTLASKDQLKAAAGQEIELPIRVASAMQVGAVSMILDIPSNMINIQDIRVNGSNDPVSWAVNGNELRIGWYSSTPVNVAENGNLLTLKLKTSDAFKVGESMEFALPFNSLNELADGSFKTIDGASLFVAQLLNGAGVTGINPLENGDLSLSNYPNPFRNSTTIDYKLPVSGKVSIDVYNTTGQLVQSLVNANQDAGDYSIRMDANNLRPGIYFARLRLTNDGTDLTGTVKLSVLK